MKIKLPNPFKRDTPDQNNDDDDDSPVIKMVGTPIGMRKKRIKPNRSGLSLDALTNKDNDNAYGLYDLNTNESTSSQFNEMKLKVFESMSFACGGWLQFYMFGVAKSLQDHNLDQKISKLAGCSAGALTAVGIALEGDFDLAIDICKKECVPRCYQHWAGWGLFGIGEYAEHTMNKTCNIHRWDELGDRLELAITRLPFFQAERAKEFHSTEDLKQALLASASCYPFAPLIHRKNSWCMDGGMSDFQPIINENTITVSPFYFSSADIKPSRYVPLWWSFFPPKDEDTIEWLYHLGQEDMARFIAAVDDTLMELDQANDEDDESTGNNDGNTSSSEESEVKRSMSHADLYRVHRRPEPHAYDIRRKISLHRFLGFQPQNFFNSYIVLIGDTVLFLVLILFWKPFALTMIYAELILKIIAHLTLGVIREFLQMLPMILLCLALCGPHITLAWGLSLVLLAQKIVSVGPAVAFKSRRGELWDCVACLGSLSLARRFVSGGLSVDEIRQNDRLVQTSVVYRIVRHII